MFKIINLVANIVYAFFKLLPTKNKVVFLSRQSNKPSIDAKLLTEELHKQSPDTEVVLLFKTMDNKVAYLFHMLTQMYHIATAKVAVLDSYCILASVLKHKKDFKIVQIWHALGSLKRFGYSILGEEEGSSESMARGMKMHANYDAILTSSETSKPYFAEGFGYPEETMKVMSLPVVDLMTSKAFREEKAALIYAKYPELKTKKNIVYAPTFNKTKEGLEAKSSYLNLVEHVNFENYNFIAKLHPLTQIKDSEKNPNVLYDREFTTMEMLSVADYVILDYSATVYEAALMQKPLFFYTPDLEDYKGKRNFYIDFEKEMPGLITGDAKAVIAAIEGDDYDLERVKAFAKKYVEHQENCAHDLAKYVLELGKIK